MLLLDNGGLYKTTKFAEPRYVGDPVNAVRIFNEKEADELVLLDYRASKLKREPDYAGIRDIAGEAFMPMAYGGGIRSLEQAKKVFDCGFEKVILNSILYENPSLAGEIAAIYGSQAVVASVDVKSGWFGKEQTYAYSGSRKTGKDVISWATQLVNEGVGELIINSIDHDGTWEGYHLPLIDKVSKSVSIPVVALGGAGKTDDLYHAVKAGASAVAAGSMFVFQKKGKGVLISFPTGLSI